MAEPLIELAQIHAWNFATLPGGNVALLIEVYPDEAAFRERRPTIHRFGLSAAAATENAQSLSQFAAQSLDRERREAGNA